MAKGGWGDLANQFKANIRNALKAADNSLAPASKELKITEMATHYAAEDVAAVARYTHIDQVADAVQTVEGAGGVAKGGIKLFQVMKNPEARAALTNMVKRAPDAWDIAKQMNARTSAFRAEQAAVKNFGMRPHDLEVFKDAAREKNRWVLVRTTNPESLPHIGKPGYTSKGIDCKAKTANMAGHPQAGLVVDPNIHPTAYSQDKLAGAKEQWDKMHILAADGKTRVLPPGYEVELNKASPRYGCLMHEGKYIHADYDIYDIIHPDRPLANLTPVEKLYGETHFKTRGIDEVGKHVNDHMGTPMVRHGGDFQFRGHTNDTVLAISPKGETSMVKGRQALEELYDKKFQGRQGFDHSVPGAVKDTGRPDWSAKEYPNAAGRMAERSDIDKAMPRTERTAERAR